MRWILSVCHLLSGLDPQRERERESVCVCEREERNKKAQGLPSRNLFLQIISARVGVAFADVGGGCGDTDGLRALTDSDDKPRPHTPSNTPDITVFHRNGPLGKNSEICPPPFFFPFFFFFFFSFRFLPSAPHSRCSSPPRNQSFSFTLKFSHGERA